MELIKLMVKNGADVNAVPNYNTFSRTNVNKVGEAASQRATETVAFLLANGENPDGCSHKFRNYPITSGSRS